MSPNARQEKIRQEFVALYQEPSKALETSRRRVVSWQTMIVWLSIFTAVILLLGIRGWPIAVLAFILGLAAGIGIWMRTTMNWLPEFLKHTTLRPESFPEPNQPPEPPPALSPSKGPVQPASDRP